MAPGTAWAAPDTGPPLPRMEAAIPTLLDHVAMTPADLDGDGTDELIALTQDGVTQRYDADGTFRWSVSTIEAAFHAGHHPIDGSVRFEADYRGRTSCTTDHGMALFDRTGDGVLDVLATSWVQLEDPVIEQRSLVVEVDGATGDVLNAHRFEGWVTNLHASDLDGDGAADLVVTEEDGPVQELTDADGRVLRRGTGGTTRIHAYDLESWERRWSHDTGRGWAQVNALAVAGFGPAAPGVTVAVTGPAATPTCGPTDPGGPGGQDLLMLDGATGATRWSAPAAASTEALVAHDADGDGTSHIVARSRSAGASGVTVFDGPTGSIRWTAALPSGAGAWDVAVDGPDVLVAYATASSTPAAEQAARLARLNGTTGAVIHDVLLDGGTTPQAASGAPTVSRMRIAVADLAPVPGGETVVRTDRMLSAVDATGRILWQRPPYGSPNVVLTARQDGMARLWAQGPFPEPLPHERREPLHVREYGRYRLFRLDGLTGQVTREVPLMGNAVGLVRLDITGDGVPDRIMGGTGEALFAMEGGTHRVVWSRPLETPVLEILTEDLDGDDAPELIVEGLLEVHAVNAGTGAVRWSYRLSPAAGPGRWSGLELADMTGDGVRDVVLATSSGADGGLNVVEQPRVLVLDGTSGEEVWHRPLPPPVKRVNGMAVGDVNRDGVPDVGIANEALGAPWLYSVAVLDGVTGAPLWTQNERDKPGGRAVPMDAVQMVDAGADGDADLAVLVVGDAAVEPAVRMHDGASGAELWLTETGTEEGDGVVAAFERLAVGRLDPDEPPLLLATARENGPDGGLAYVHGLTASGQTVFVHHAPTPNIWELETGDVTGDGIGDVIVPWLRGFGVIDGASALDGTPKYVGHLRERFPSKAKLFDVDGDGVLEIETLVTPGAWPLQLGQVLLTDVGVPSKAVGVIDLSP